MVNAMFTRRKFVGGASALAAATFGFPHLAQSSQQLHRRTGQRPRHIIHLVADGMSLGTLSCADQFSWILRGRGLTWMELWRDETSRRGLMNMRSLNSLVTDSSAASSSWGCGARVMNGKVNKMRDGRDLTPLYELFNQAGWRRGLVTTTEITHATPAGFAANADSRDNGDQIAAQYLARKVDVLLGGGKKFFLAKERKDKRDLLNDFRLEGYIVVDNLADLQAAPLDRRWLGTFDSSHLPYTIDHRRNEKKRATVPTLATMTSRALDWLGARSNFILQVEGGRVDHGCHNCDAAAAVYEQIAFDEALDVCLEFQRQVPDTLLVITTDHGNGNMGLNGMGDSYGQSSTLFHNLLQVKRSFPEILGLLRKSEKAKGVAIAEKEEKAIALNPLAHPTLPPTKEELAEAAKKPENRKEKEIFFVKPTKEIIDVIHESTGYKLSEERAARLAPFLANKGVALYDMMKSETAALGQIMANRLGISFTGTAHTSDYVPIMAVGPGSERFMGFLENTEVFYRYLALGKVDFRNPSEPEIADAGPAAGDVELITDYALV
jgi:alkaline phosphatase